MDNVRVIDLPKIVDPRGNLTVAEQIKNIPFGISRVYWTYDVPSGERRGGAMLTVHVRRLSLLSAARSMLMCSMERSGGRFI